MDNDRILTPAEIELADAEEGMRPGRLSEATMLELGWTAELVRVEGRVVETREGLRTPDGHPVEMVDGLPHVVVYDMHKARDLAFSAATRRLEAARAAVAAIQTS